MSWSFDHTGTRAGVAEKIKNESHVPASVKAAIVDILDAPKVSACNGVKVVSHGHVDSYSANLKLEITQVTLVLDPVPEKPTAATG